mgnify:CR=1 FL=1
MKETAQMRVAEPDESLARKEQLLRGILARLDGAVVAFSGGADSAFLAYVAHGELGERALCVTADSPSYPRRHRDIVLRLVTQLGLHHQFIRTREMDRAEYRANPVNRCYFCKQELYGELCRIALERGIAAVLDGNNADIRRLSRAAGLLTWDEPASACLSSRIPYMSEVTGEKLRMIEGAETVLHDLGFRVCRVRHHGDTARLELDPSDMPRALDEVVRARILHELRAVGFRYVTLDLQGYRTGSLNEVLRLRPV